MESTATNPIRETAAFVVPFVVFMVISSFYPKSSEFDDPAKVSRYIWLIAIQVALGFGWLIWFSRIHRRHFPIWISPLSILVGVVGIVAWIGICSLQIEQAFWQWIGKGEETARPSFDPFKGIADSTVRTQFLILRFTLLAVLVPIIEELFLRGWFVRWFQDPNWEGVDLRKLSWKALLVPSIYGALAHPNEMIAAVVWFGLVTWLARRTGNLWDCVVAHAVTNLLLGIYVVKFSAWHLW